MRARYNSERGSVLVTTLIITALVTIVVGALLMVVQRQNYFTARSTTWCSEIPIAEAGIEDAMAFLNSRRRGLPIVATNGWTNLGPNIVKSRYFTNGSAAIADGYYFTAISTARPPTIVSIGYGRIPGLKTNYTHRTVVALTKENPPVYGIRAQNLIRMGGATTIDSFNSTNSQYSTLGRYDPAKADDQAAVSSLSSAVPAIQQGMIYGYVSVAPGGTASGTIGDGQWITGGNSGIEPGHFRDDYNTPMPIVLLPAGAAGWAAFPGTRTLLGGNDYIYSGNFAGSMTVNAAGSVPTRLYITGDVHMTGGDTITLLPGAKLEIYIGGTAATFGGGGIVNGPLNNGQAINVTIYALSTVATMDFKGNASLTAQVVAPNTDVDFNGTSDIFGGIVAKSIDLSGTSDIHYDEALGVNTGPPFGIISWEEQ